MSVLRFHEPRKKLGELLLEAGFISSEQLKHALEEQKTTGNRLGKVLVRLGYITEEKILEVLEHQLGIPRVDLSRIRISPDVANLVPEAVARRHQIMPVKVRAGRLTLAMADPLNVMALDDARIASGMEIDPVLASEEEINRTIDTTYRLIGSADDLLRQLGDAGKLPAVDENVGVERLRQVVDAAPVVRLVDNIIAQAVRDRASDVHIEPLEDKVRLRYRIDGVLRDIGTAPRQTHPALVSRVKVMAGMDISEKRIPQDGRIYMEIQGQEVDLRVSTLPTLFGEKIAMRILNRSQVLLNLDELGFRADLLRRYRNVIQKPYGMILVTGPTGSGKTTTLYATLNEINSVEKNIVTVEDPVEYRLEGISQVQTNPKAGLTFANSLRSIVRQDPDVIMVGEIRDTETARIAVQSAMTGHLVLSTIHTNDAASTLTRLIDMGIEPYLVSASVIAIVAQRLVRKICPSCKTKRTLTARELLSLGLPGGIDEYEGRDFYVGEGCVRCQGTGFYGRTAIHELLVVESRIRELINVKASTDAIHSAAATRGWRSLFQDGMEKAALGITSVEEVVRASWTGE